MAYELNNGIKVLDNRKDIPLGKPLLDKFSHSKILNKDLIIWELDGVKNNEVWLLATTNLYSSPEFKNLIKEIEASEYKLIKKCLINPVFLNALYH